MFQCKRTAHIANIVVRVRNRDEMRFWLKLKKMDETMAKHPSVCIFCADSHSHTHTRIAFFGHNLHCNGKQSGQFQCSVLSKLRVLNLTIVYLFPFIFDKSVCLCLCVESRLYGFDEWLLVNICAILSEFYEY